MYNQQACQTKHTFQTINTKTPCTVQTHPPKVGDEIFFFFNLHGSPLEHFFKVKIKLSCLLCKDNKRN